MLNEISLKHVIGGSAIFLAKVCTAALAIALQTSPIISSAVPDSQLTVKEIGPDVVKNACLQAVQREETATKKIRVTSVTASSDKLDAAATCIVKESVAEGPGLVMHSGAVMVTDIQYNVAVDLASQYIDMKSAAIAPDQVTFAATVAGMKCTVEVSTKTTAEPKRWLVEKIDCRH